MDFSVDSLDGMGQAERQRLCRQLRRRQVEAYLEKEGPLLREQPQPSRALPRKPNRRGTTAHFHLDLFLQAAVEEADEKKVLKLLQSGCNFNFSTGNGTSLLHKCCAEGNLSMAEILILKGADVNARDDDWWTPLHVACYQDNADIVQLLLINGADVSLLDVDGNFPIDHATQHSDTWDHIISFMESKGLSESKVKKLRQTRGHQMENDVTALVRTGQDLNSANEDGVTLLHIASANGYVKCGKMLLKQGADVTKMTDSLGWTPLHCAAKFGQAKMTTMLIKYGADFNATDKGGNKPLDLAAGEEIQRLILEARSAARKSRASSVYETVDGEEEEEELACTTKIVRPSHLPLSKADRLMEGQMLNQARSLPPIPTATPAAPSAGRPKGRGAGTAALQNMADKDDNDEDEVYEEIFANNMYSISETDEGKLPECSETDDLSSLPSLTEPVILDTMLKRFADKQIYTYMGDVLIAANPFTDLPLYGKWASKIYREAKALTPLPPHPYAVAEHAQRVLLSSRTNQCCVIGGESGAGKTETSKLLVQHLMCGATSSEHQLHSKLHQINPLLEAFGNARTVMNDNSSRFAKYLELVFAPDGCVLGGHLDQYLLEKSRVVHQGAGETNFHIFYWLLHGATPEEKTQCLLDTGQFRYLSSNPRTLGGRAQQKLLEVKDCMKFVGFSQDDITSMLMTVAAVVHLGDVTFTDGGDGHAVSLTQPAVLHKVCKLLRVSFEDLSSALTEDLLTARGEEVRRRLTLSQCQATVQAAAMAVYSRLFGWIVNGINQMVAPLDDYTGEKLTIGILDIFGFENLQSNGFEQMCINLANERLQQFFQNQVFERELLECVTEGVPPVDVIFPSSQAVLDLFMEKNTGVYDLLDEESAFPKATDETLTTKLHQYLGQKHGEVYKVPRHGGSKFTVVHYAGAVLYDVQGVLEKNRDTLRHSLAFVMRSSESQLVKELFQSTINKTGSLTPSARQRVSRKMKPSRSPFDFFKKLRMSKADPRGNKKPTDRAGGTASKKSPSTLTFHFKNSLREMLSKLEASTPHFIRCVKPNPSARPLHADTEYVGAQLRYSGVLQTAVLRQQGYAVRITFRQLVVRLPALAVFDGGQSTSTADDKSCVTKVLKAFSIPLSQVGLSKVFLRLQQEHLLEDRNSQLTAKVITAQAAVRRHQAVRFVARRRAAREEYRRQLDIQKRIEEEEEAKRVKAAAEEEERRAREEGVEGEEVVRRRNKGGLVGVAPEIRRSLEFLDSVLDEFYTEGLPDVNFMSSDGDNQCADDEYQEAFSFYPHPNFIDDNDNNNNDDDKVDRQGEDLYRDAASLSAQQLTGEADDMHRKHTNHHPHLPQHPHQYQQYPSFHPHADVVFDPSTGGRAPIPPSPREMYSAHKGYNQGLDNGHQSPGMCGKRVPPPLPERSPDTQLSTSRKSSVSSKDSVSSQELCSEGNEVFESNNHHHHHNHQHPHSPTATSAGANSQRYAASPDSRPFSYAAGIDPKALQRQLSANGTSGPTKARAVSAAGGCHSQPQQHQQQQLQQQPPPPPFPAPHQHQHHEPPSPPPPPPPGAEPSGSPGGGGGGRGVVAAGFQPYADYRRKDATAVAPGGPPPPPVNGSSPHQHQHHRRHHCPPQDLGAGVGGAGGGGGLLLRGGGGGCPPPQSLQYDAQPGYPVLPPPPPPATSSSSSSGQSRAGSFQYPPPPPPQQQQQQQPQAALYGNVAGSAPVPSPGGGGGSGGSGSGGLVSPRHHNQHTHHHIVTKPHPSPPSARRSSSSPSRGAGSAGSPVTSAFQPVTAAPPPPTFPAPPPPLPVHDRYLAATQETRSPSPPLPPPPAAAPPVADHGAVRGQRPAKEEAERSQSPLGIRLKPTAGKFSNIYQEQGSAPGSPQSPAGADFSQFPKREPEVVDPHPPPPPPAPPAPAAPPPAPTPGQGIESQLVAAVSRMEIEIPDDVDISECPGLVEITGATPNWKREMIEKKNREKIEEFVKQKMREKENEAKWRNVPEWKRALMMKKDQEDQAAAQTTGKTSPEKPAKSSPAKGEQPPTPMPKPKGDIVPAALSIDPAELESMPPWKRELLFKREKVPITFSNEFNPDEDEENEENTQS